MSHRHAAGDWFERELLLRHYGGPDAPPAAAIGRPVLSMLLGAASGGIGAITMLSVAQLVAMLRRSWTDLFTLVGDWLVPSAAPARHAVMVGALIVLLAGALLGTGLGYLTRRAVHIFPRLLFFTTLMPAVWIFAHAFIVRPLAPHVASALPVVPMLLGAVAFGVCMAVVVPPGTEPRTR